MAGSTRLKRETRLFQRADRYMRCRNRRRLFGILTRHPDLLHMSDGERSLLMSACWRYEYEIVEWMLKHGANPDLVGSKGVNTPLIYAAVENDLRLARLLLEFGADIEKANDTFETPLGFACAYDAIDVVRLLCERGANVNGTEGWGSSYLYGVQCAKQTEIENILVSYGAKVIHEEPKLKAEGDEEAKL